MLREGRGKSKTRIVKLKPSQAASYRVQLQDGRRKREDRRGKRVEETRIVKPSQAATLNCPRSRGHKEE